MLSSYSRAKNDHESEEVFFESKRELLEELGKQIKEKARSQLTWEPPYDKADLEEMLGKVRSRPVRGDAKGKKGGKAKSKVKHVSTYLIRGEPHLGRMYKWMGEVTRRALNLNSPIPLEQLGEELNRIEASIDSVKCKTKTLVWYPSRDWIEGAHPGMHIWEVDCVWLPDITPNISDDRLKFRLGEAILDLSIWLNCHPALALAFLLCDMPVHEDIVTVVIDPFFRMSLYVRRPEVPMWLIRRLSKFARSINLTQKRLRFHSKASTGKTFRPRGVSRRVSTLIAFVRLNKDLNWMERCATWNADFEQWKYKDWNTMKTIYNRAKPLTYKGQTGENMIPPLTSFFRQIDPLLASLYPEETSGGIDNK